MRVEVDKAIGAVWRIESAKIVAGVARLVRDIGLAEELAGDALVAALEHWPTDGVPDKPGAWLMRTAKNAALDRLRRDKVFQEKLQQIGLDLEAREALTVPDFVDGLDAARHDVIGDDLLRLMFTSLPPGALARCAGGADAQAARRPDHPGDRARLPRARADHRPAHRARQAHARECPRALRAARAGGAGGTAGRGAGGGLPDLQRRLYRQRAATGCARRCSTRPCGWGACWPSWRRHPRRTAWPR
jgi:hypothetical protein